METEIAEDIGEEIIAKLKELNEILREIIRRRNEKECTNLSCTRTHRIEKSKQLTREKNGIE